MSKVTKTITITITHDDDNDIASDVNYFEDTLSETFSEDMAELKCRYDDGIDRTSEAYSLYRIHLSWRWSARA